MFPNPYDFEDADDLEEVFCCAYKTLLPSISYERRVELMSSIISATIINQMPEEEKKYHSKEQIEKVATLMAQEFCPYSFHFANTFGSDENDENCEALTDDSRVTIQDDKRFVFVSLKREESKIQAEEILDKLFEEEREKHTGMYVSSTLYEAKEALRPYIDSSKNQNIQIEYLDYVKEDIVASIMNRATHFYEIIDDDDYAWAPGSYRVCAVGYVEQNDDNLKVVVGWYSYDY